MEAINDLNPIIFKIEDVPAIGSYRYQTVKLVLRVGQTAEKRLFLGL
ncbi:MAG: hypothetical protein Q8942_05985 [Bacillota bacterium]|nr:hypothetical protein [Bacillota bacterium]